MRLVFAVAAACLLASSAFAEGSGPFGVDPLASEPFAAVAASHEPGSCHVQHAGNGMQLPDPACTPGAVNPTVTAGVLQNPAFRTGAVRDQLTSAAQKQIVYVWYGLLKPKNNVGPNQICDIDHLVSLGLGGSDALENLWPQCGPGNVPVGRREFKIKDAHVELGLMKRVKAGADLADIQQRIAADWTQFLPTGH